MASSPETMCKIDDQIRISNDAICRHIDKVDLFGRGIVSQDILKNIRDFVEHIMLKIYANNHEMEYCYDAIKDGIRFVKTKGQLKFLWKFHDYIQIVASHYLLDAENSERVMLKYYEHLLRIKDFMKNKYSTDVLGNLDKFPLNTANDMQGYYKKIAQKIDNRDSVGDLNSNSNDRFYIYKIKPFFIDQRIYYEVTFIPVTGEKASKFERIIAFTACNIPKYYATKLTLVEDNIQILDKTMPIFIITKWETSIRPCEIERFLRIFGVIPINHGSSAEYKGLMRYLTKTGFNLIELLSFGDEYYRKVKTGILFDSKAKVNHIFDIFDKARSIINNNNPGCNILRYLLYHLNNNIIKDQLYKSNNRLSGLCLKNGCIPFDQMPFNSSLLGHNPKLGDLFDCINSSDRMHEILARIIHNNTEIQGQLYTPLTNLDTFEDVNALIQIYNNKLYCTHQERRIEERNGHLYIQGYENDTIDIIKNLGELSKKRTQNYSNSVSQWLLSGVHPVDCKEKKDVLVNMFETSAVALIYGSAGTGKSTLINHISHFFSKHNKLYLANTNPAVDNLKRRVDASNCVFMTVTKFITTANIGTKYTLLFIDECSTLNNRDMKKILYKAQFDLLILVGDIYQIGAIRFGNWFSAAKRFLPTGSVYELTIPYRSKNNKELQTLWNRVRNMDDTIIEFIAKQRYSVSLDSSIFLPAEKDEIILCLNYDGLYGINNINRFLQEANPNPPKKWKLQVYKVGDPILFNESKRFTPLIYNNMKGWIAGIATNDKKIRFDIELDKAITSLDAGPYDFELLPNSPNNNSVIRFLVDKYNSTDESDDDPSSTAVVPFQISYAVSIHKAQGLEYNSVKIVITDEIDDLVTHDIFYTAITRTQKKLKIYWTPEVEHRVLSRIKPKNNNKDVELLKKCIKTKEL